MYEPPLTKTDDNCGPTTWNISICCHRGTRTSPHKCSGTVPNKVAACSLRGGIRCHGVGSGKHSPREELNWLILLPRPDYLLLMVAVRFPLPPPPAQQVNLGRNFSYYIRDGTVRISTGTWPYLGVFVVFISASTQMSGEHLDSAVNASSQFVSNSSSEIRSTDCNQSFVINHSPSSKFQNSALRYATTTSMHAIPVY